MPLSILVIFYYPSCFEFSIRVKPQWIEALLAGRFAAPTSAGVLLKQGCMLEHLDKNRDRTFGFALILFSFFVFVMGLRKGMPAFEDSSSHAWLILAAIFLWTVAIFVGRYILIRVFVQRLAAFVITGLLATWYVLKDEAIDRYDWFLIFAFALWCSVELVHLVTGRRKNNIIFKGWD